MHSIHVCDRIMVDVRAGLLFRIICVQCRLISSRKPFERMNGHPQATHICPEVRLSIEYAASTTRIQETRFSCGLGRHGG